MKQEEWFVFQPVEEKDGDSPDDYYDDEKWEKWKEYDEEDEQWEDWEYDEEEGWN